MSGFKDTFTKDEDQKDVLGYDDTAFKFFASTVLLVIAIPWTHRMIMNFLYPGKDRLEKAWPTVDKQKRKFTRCTTTEMQKKYETIQKETRKSSAGDKFWMVCKILILAAIWVAIFYVFTQITGGQDIKGFDPFAILGVESGSTPAEIKKAYRKLSLVYHPDKNPNNPEAESTFIQITKAYGCLTDEVQKANYEKYGNPDGRQAEKFGIGLPSFLIKKDNHLIILSIFFFMLLVIIPAIAINYYNKTKIYAANGLMVDTMYIIGQNVEEGTRVKNCPELLAASEESRRMIYRGPFDDAATKKLGSELESPPVMKWKKAPPVMQRNNHLLQAHMQRLHDEMTAEQKSDLDELLRHSMKITQAMIDVACMREWVITAENAIQFRRCLVQALNHSAPGSSELLQIPHITTERIKKHITSGSKPVKNLKGYLTQDPSERKGVVDLSETQRSDIDAFVNHVSKVELVATVQIDGEEPDENGQTVICVGDLATVTITLTRTNLQDGEAAGAVSAPFFPEPKFEQWHIFLTESMQTVPRLISAVTIKDCGKVCTEKIMFMVQRPGAHNLKVTAYCDSYEGVDQKQDVKFDAKTPDQVKRDYFVHKEDEDLDLAPTLFQQMMGVQKEEESEEEEDEEDTKSKPKAKSVGRDLGDSPKAAAVEDSDDDEKKDDASSSGSDSD